MPGRPTRKRTLATRCRSPRARTSPTTGGMREMSLMAEPGADGRFGEFGGRFVPESLMPACLDLEQAFKEAWADPEFHKELDDLLHHYGGRPTPVTECRRLSEQLGVRVLLKREDLAHTGSHQLNDVVAQALLIPRM